MSFAALIRHLVLFMTIVELSCSMAAGQQQTTAKESRRHRYILEQRATIQKDFAFELNQVSEWCRENELDQAATDVMQMSLDLTTDDPTTGPSRMVTLPISLSLPEAERQWRETTRQLREDRAKDLYTLARKALRAGLPSIAYRLVQDVLRLNPDHANARAILGQQKFHDPLHDDDDTYAGEWVSPWEAKKRGVRTPHLLDARFGWIPREHLKRYEEGMRPWKGSWHSQQKDDLIRSDFRNAWEIESEHFLVRTNVGLEEGVLLSQRLETYYEWLRQTFAAFFDTPADLKARFEQATVRRRSRARTPAPMEVWYYATRDEYQRQIRRKVPPEIETNGLYWQPDRRCYFFKNAKRDGLDTLFHEATHQILDVPTRQARVTASRTIARRTRSKYQEWILGGQSEFWVIEGLACYFESFDVQDGVIKVGRPDHIRQLAAQTRLLRDGFYIPLETFCRLGKQEFQHHPNRAQLYSQASGVAHFLMHYDDGRYRDDLVTLLEHIYRPDGRNPQMNVSLAEITGVGYTELNKQYREHMENLFQQNHQLQQARQQDIRFGPR